MRPVGRREKKRGRHSRPRLPELPSIRDSAAATQIVGLAVSFRGFDGRTGWGEADLAAGRAGGDQEAGHAVPHRKHQEMSGVTGDPVLRPAKVNSIARANLYSAKREVGAVAHARPTVR